MESHGAASVHSNLDGGSRVTSATSGRHLFINPNVNQAALDPNCAADGTCNNFNARRLYYQKFGLTQGIYETCNCDNSSYHALQAKVQKRASHGLDFLATYTYGKAMANSETGRRIFQQPELVAGPWSGQLRPHPDGHHQLRLGAALRTRAAVWRIRESGGRLGPRRLGLQRSRHFRVGLALHAQHLGCEPGFRRLEPGASRPEWRVPACRTPAPTSGSILPPSSRPQSPGRNGDVRHNSFRGPGLYNFDLSLGKIFTVAEGKTLEFKWENYNATNHVNLANPNPTVDVTGAGQITAAATMRQMQFGLHFRY